MLSTPTVMLVRLHRGLISWGFLWNFLSRLSCTIDLDTDYESNYGHKAPVAYIILPAAASILFPFHFSAFCFSVGTSPSQHNHSISRISIWQTPATTVHERPLEFALTYHIKLLIDSSTVSPGLAFGVHSKANFIIQD